MDDEQKKHQRCCHRVSVSLLDKTSVLQPEATENLESEISGAPALDDVDWRISSIVACLLKTVLEILKNKWSIQKFHNG